MLASANNSIALPKLPLTFLKSPPPKPYSSLYTVSLRPSLRLMRSAALSGSGGGGGDALYGGGWGSSRGGGGETKSSSIMSAGVSDLGISDNEDDVIILSVAGMSCDGCAASVKRILENQPQVSQATVSFEKEQAVIWVVPEAKATDNWQQELAQILASHLTTCGFKSNHQEQGRTFES